MKQIIKRSITIASIILISTFCIASSSFADFNALEIEETIPRDMHPGETRSAIITLENTGTDTWDESNVRLNTLGNWGLITSYKLGTGETKAQGQQKTFNLVLTAPTEENTHDCDWQMQTRPENEYFGDLVHVSVNVNSSVTPELDAVIVSHTIPPQIDPDNTVSVTVILRNTGSTTWDGSDPNPIRFRTRNAPEDLWGPIKNYYLVPTEMIPPGGLKTFTFDITAPLIEENTPCKWRMQKTWGVQNTVFGELLDVPVTVGTPSCTDDNDCNPCFKCDSLICIPQLEGEDVKEECDGVCTTGFCDGAGDCAYYPDTTECRPSVDDCDIAENCTGSSATCPADGFEPGTTVCRAAIDVCDIAENCTGSSATCPADGFEPGTTVCRASAGACDVAETCPGDSADCPTDGYLTAGTECRGTAGDCDVAETCPGDSADCPADVYLTTGTECRGTAGDCDVAEICPGDSADCPTDGYLTTGTECRGTAGDCDVAETCPGDSADCPADGFLNSNVCRAANGDCDAAEICPGDSADCPADGFLNSNVCRAANGDCDAAEICPGDSADCPADVYLTTGTECRGTAGDCDVAETCPGDSADCPADGYLTTGTECRGTAGDCDVAEICPGDSADCPTDGYLTTGTECRGTAGDCDVAETCPGDSADCPADGFLNSNVCRAANGDCDAAEICPGDSADCPADGFLNSNVCRAANGDCDAAEICPGDSADCPADGFLNSNVCRAANGDCDAAETCPGDSADCPADAFEPDTTECRASAGDCDVAENCTGSSATCPADGYVPNGTPCNDTLYCTQVEYCQGGTCIGKDPCDDNGDYCDGVEFCEEGTGDYLCPTTGDPCVPLACDVDTCEGSDVALIIGDSSANPGTVDLILENDVEISEVTVNVCDIDERFWLHIDTDTCTLTPRTDTEFICDFPSSSRYCVEVHISSPSTSATIPTGSGAIVQLSYILDTDAPVGEIADIKPDIISMYDESIPITATTPVPGIITVPGGITTTISSTTTTTVPITTTTTVPPVSTTTTTTGPGPECSFDSDCNDGNDCTIDECSAEVCNNTPFADGAECGEELFCTLDASCVAGECVGTARDCDDGEFCTGVESCDEEGDGCVSPGDPCTSPEVCDEDEDVCRETPLPCDISIEPSSAAVGSGETLSLTVTQEGDCDDPDYVWSVASSIGSSVDQGNYTAGNTFLQAASDVVSVVDHGNGDITAAATITVSPKCSLVKIYGERSKEVKILRLFRDSVLSQSPEGQEIIRLYYELSPVIAKAIDEDEEFKGEVKETVDSVLRLIMENSE